MGDEKLHLYLKITTIVTIVTTIIFLGFILWWLYFPYQPIVTMPKPYAIVFPEDKVVEPGGYITYEFQYEKKTDIIAVIQRQFIDGLVFNVAGPQTPTVSSRGKGIARVQLTVPETLPPGTYYVRITATYQMNPLRSLDYINVTETFEVKEGCGDE